MQVRANGIDVHYTVQGEGPCLVFSHSLACNTGMWDEQVAEFAKKYKVLCYDTRGHGKTSAPAGAYTLDQLADDLKGMLDALNIKQPHFIGLSMGGMIGQVTALKYPGIFKTLTLADTTSRYAPEAKALWDGRIKTANEKGMGVLVDGTLERWFTAPYRTANPDQMARVGNYIKTTPVAGYCGCIQAIQTINATDRLKEIKSPVLVICGEEDGGTPPAMARAIHHAIPQAEYSLLASAAHLSNVERPVAFNSALGRFLAKHP